ncbi:MAG: hypothetical protein J0L92_21000 [Deltaproteobacteria bacterium]|nr:hypothetical protein [Deltaproteobacteria bacterium]
MRRLLLLLAFTTTACDPSGEAADASALTDSAAVGDAARILDASALDAGALLDGALTPADASTLSDTAALDGSSLTDAVTSPDALEPADAFEPPDAFEVPDAFVAPDAFVPADAFAARVDLHVHIDVDNTCRMTVTPREVSVPPGQTLYLDWHNHSRDYPVDVWMSYGGGYTDLATGATWDEPIGHCSTPFVGDEYADISTACSSFRFLIHCR